jgi:hypothetical protein
MLICAGTYEDILSIILFGVCSNIAFSAVIENGESPGIAVGWTILEIVTGLGIGIVFGLFSKVFNLITHPTARIWSKFLYCCVCAIAVVIGDTVSGWSNAKFVGTLFFGYTCQLMWKEDKPVKLLGSYWYYI